jgi:hypothetical protein
LRSSRRKCRRRVLSGSARRCDAARAPRRARRSSDARGVTQRQRQDSGGLIRRRECAAGSHRCSFVVIVDSYVSTWDRCCPGRRRRRSRGWCGTLRVIAPPHRAGSSAGPPSRRIARIPPRVRVDRFLPVLLLAPFRFRERPNATRPTRPRPTTTSSGSASPVGKSSNRAVRPQVDKTETPSHCIPSPFQNG